MAHDKQVNQKVPVIKQEIPHPIRPLPYPSRVKHSSNILLFFIHRQYDKRPRHNDIPLEREHVIGVFLVFGLLLLCKGAIRIIIISGLVDHLHYELVKKHEEQKDDNVNVVAHEESNR